MGRGERKGEGKRERKIDREKERDKLTVEFSRDPLCLLKMQKLD